MKKDIEFKKYGNGSQTYEVFLVVDYSSITKRKKYVSLGFIQKNEKQWQAMDGKIFTGKTRKEVAEKLVMDYTLNNA